MSHLTRRAFLNTCSVATASASLLRNSTALPADGGKVAGVQVIGNTYPWATFAKRAGQKLALHTDQLLDKFVQSGFDGYEPIIEDPAEFQELTPRLKAHGLVMPSIYINVKLHDADALEKAFSTAVSIARAAAENDVKVIVTDPEPINWNSDDDKTDEQLIRQARALDRLGAEFNKLGLSLACHNHAHELRHGGREFHHMLTGTDPEHVKFCLDAHWIYRGCGNSQVGLFDAIEMYADRIIELHVRQSKDGVWTQNFSANGDIDYPRLVTLLKEKNLKPLIVMEQAIEPKSEVTLDPVAAHKITVQEARDVFCDC